VPATCIDNPIARDLIIFEVKSPIATSSDANETQRFAQYGSGIDRALAHLRFEDTTVEQPSFAERAKKEILLAERLFSPGSADANTINMPAER
jgi:hypothetical protein